MLQRVGASLVSVLVVGAAALATPSASAVVPPGSAYRQANLVSDVPGLATVLDPSLVGPWGLTSLTTGPLRATSTTNRAVNTYRTSGSGAARPTSNPRTSLPGGAPTAVVANSGGQFLIYAGGIGPARFLWGTSTGSIVAWNDSLSPTSALVAKTNPGRSYTGVAIGSASNGTRLYAVDFANGQIDVYDGTFGASSVAGGFADATIPTGFRPYNIANLDGSLYVSYAKAGAGGSPEVGTGKGYVRKFSTDGVRDLAFAVDTGALSAPWGLAVAPATFGTFSGGLIVGNDDDGTSASLHAYHPSTGALLGTLADDQGEAIRIEHLRGLQFGNGNAGGASGTLYFSAGIAGDQHGLLGSLAPSAAPAPSTVALSAASSTTGEAAGTKQITVQRTGDVSSPATVRYSTWDRPGAGRATQKNDYQINAGVLTLPAGQTSAAFTIIVGDDKLVEGPEQLDVSLSNPVGTQLGGISRATVTITDNDIAPTTANPIDTSTFFVYRHYLDFFNRLPDAGGLAHWKGKLDACGSNTTCLANARVAVSASFFTSSEFQNGMSLAYRTRKAALGRAPVYGELMVDNQVRRAVGTAGMNEAIAADPEVVLSTGSLSNTSFVDAVIANSEGTFSAASRSAWISALNGGTSTRAVVLGEVAADPTAKDAAFRPAFVFMQYAGYLRRDPDPSGYGYWLNRLNSFSGDYVAAGMVKNFVTSSEYRHRFGA